jgi:formate dehydrogenase subunit gamma
MRALPRACRLVLAICALFMLVGLVTPAAAQQPNSVNPTASSVKEDQLLQQMRIISGRGTIPDAKSYNLEQPGGRDWRYFQQVILPWITAIAILGMLAILVVFYLVRGMVRLKRGRSGRVIVRFNAFERFIHWMTATCFVILAISGLNISVGKAVLLPLMSAEAFTTWSQWLKYAHNYLSFPFTLGVILIFVTWIAANLPTRLDVIWFKEGGGIVGDRDPPADHFNAGQKTIYWVVVLAGIANAVTGYLLMFPFSLTDVAGMQVTQMIHAIVGMVFIAIMIGHIYIGTIGMEGAFEAMGTGTVDLNWAKQHHSVWTERELAKGSEATLPPRAATTPAE